MPSSDKARCSIVSRFVGFPLSPAAYVLNLAWVLKAGVLRYGGIKLYRFVLVIISGLLGYNRHRKLQGLPGIGEPTPKRFVAVRAPDNLYPGRMGSAPMRWSESYNARGFPTTGPMK